MWGHMGAHVCMKGACARILGQVAWRRVVLDEAHSIKDRRCSTARAVFALNSKYKWALSGTPLQARVFLQIPACF